jgi:two-component system sensor histidine kinase UhpB
VPPGDWSKAIQVEVIFYTSCAFLLTVFLVSMVLALRGNQAAKYFLWVWAALMIWRCRS